LVKYDQVPRGSALDNHTPHLTGNGIGGASCGQGDRKVVRQRRNDSTGDLLFGSRITIQLVGEVAGAVTARATNTLPLRHFQSMHPLQSNCLQLIEIASNGATSHCRVAASVSRSWASSLAASSSISCIPPHVRLFGHRPETLPTIEVLLLLYTNWSEVTAFRTIFIFFLTNYTDIRQILY